MWCSYVVWCKLQSTFLDKCNSTIATAFYLPVLLHCMHTQSQVGAHSRNPYSLIIPCSKHEWVSGWIAVPVHWCKDRNRMISQWPIPNFFIRLLFNWLWTQSPGQLSKLLVCPWGNLEREVKLYSMIIWIKLHEQVTLKYPLKLQSHFQLP